MDRIPTPPSASTALAAASAQRAARERCAVVSAAFTRSAWAADMRAACGDDCRL
jgi:hypothetical protein